MKVNSQTLMQLPIGTFFHEVDLPCEPIFEIVGYTGGDDIIIRPLFDGDDMEPRKFGFSNMPDCEIDSAEFYVLQKEDRDVIARKMGFEAEGIKVIGIDPSE